MRLQHVCSRLRAKQCYLSLFGLGTVLVPIVNVGIVDVEFYPTIVIRKLRGVYLVGLPIGLTEVLSVTVWVASCDVFRQCQFSVSEQIETVDLGGLSGEE